MSEINQKEYLKKYLSIGKKKKKRKVKKDSGLKIIDYDDETLTSIVQEDLLADNEDSPQIVAIIDERPPSLRIENSKKLWIPIGGDDSVKIEAESAESISKIKIPIKSIKKEKKDSTEITVKIERESPTRDVNVKQENDRDISPVRRNDRDKSPPKRHLNQDIRVKEEPDISPERRRDRDISPPRRKNKDISPPRRDTLRIRQDEDGDISPVRRKVRDISSPRRKTNKSDNSPVRRKERDISPPRKKTNKRDRDISPKRKNHSYEDRSPPRKNSDRNKEKDNSPPRKQTKSDTIPQNTGNDSQTPQIERISLRDMVRPKKKKEEPKIDEETQKKYTRWGVGLKQVEDIETKIADELHEMNKPLARYANDEDLDKYLREQEREGDPMLQYLRKKKKKQDIDEGKPSKPTYLGGFMPNRFGIKPGHRWDGVDRSNGYEKRWFEVQNSKMAQVEESYKWSTEDM